MKLDSSLARNSTASAISRGTHPPSFSLNCRHASQQVQFRLYNRDELAKWAESTDLSGPLPA